MVLKVRNMMIGMALLAFIGCSDSGDSPNDSGNGSPKLSVNDQEITEGVAASFTVTLSKAAMSNVIFSYTTNDGSAAQPADYQSTSGKDTIMAGATVATVDVVTVDDSGEEPCETFSLVLSSPVNATISDGTGEGTIFDNDPTEIRFAGVIRPLLQNSGCTATNCHGGGNVGGGLLLGSADYNSVTTGTGSRGKVVVRCEASLSNLYLKTTTSPPFGDRMPRFSDTLSTVQQKVLRDWIRQGARDN